jgi:hypothetical protein
MKKLVLETTAPFQGLPELVAYDEGLFAQEGIQVDTRPPRGMPDSLADLQNYELLMLSNVPATALSQRQMEVARTYVQDLGGGLIMLGGDQSFGLGGYYKTVLEEILPVRSDFEKEKEKPSLAMVLVIDKSGSMEVAIELGKQLGALISAICEKESWPQIFITSTSACSLGNSRSAASIAACRSPCSGVLINRGSASGFAAPSSRRSPFNASSTSASVGICHSIVCSSVAERSGSVAGPEIRVVLAGFARRCRRWDLAAAAGQTR